MGRRLSAEATQRSFIGVVISVIKHLSGTFCCKLAPFLVFNGSGMGQCNCLQPVS
jgi:hypothetical protein